MKTQVRFSPRLLLGLAAILCLLLAPSLVEACPTCKDSIHNDANSENLVRGYFWSILFMMSAPFLILGGLSSYFYWEVRKARAEAAAQLACQPEA